ncbi:MAG: DNRLRE domain-containing protein, partial [Chloroflexota bacterium]
MNVHVYNAPAGMSTTAGWQKLDPTLTKRLPDGSFAPANLPFGLSVAPTAAATYLASLTNEGGVTLRMGLASLGRAALSAVPGRQQGSDVLYPAPDPATTRDVAVDATASGFNVRVVLHNASENPSVTLRVALDSSAYLQQEPSGTIQATRPITSYGDSSTTPIVTLGPEFVIGHAAAVDASAGVAALVNASAPSLTLGSSSAGAQSVSVAIDPTWLHAAGRAFPVTITVPVLTALSAAHTGISATVNSCAPTKPATPTDIVVGVVGSCTNQGKLYFSLPHVPGGSTVVSATLGLYAPDQSTATGAQVYMNGLLPLPYIAPSALDQSASPALPAVAADAVGIAEQPATGSNLHTWDVTSIVRQWFQDGRINGGLTLMGGGAPVVIQSPMGSGSPNPTVDPVLSIIYVPLGTVPPTAHAAGPVLRPTTALTNISALEVTSASLTAYVVTPSGLFRSANPTFSRWERMNQAKSITAIS